MAIINFCRLLFVFAFSAASLMGDETPIVIAHRGASGYLPEHTLPAVSLAFGMGAHYIEQDIVLTKDSVPVVLHDIHIDTVTDVARRFPDRSRPDGRYYALDFTLAELKTLQVNERVDVKSGKPVFPGRFPVGKSSFRIASFEEELELIGGLNTSAKRNVGIYPEIKDPAWHREQQYDISLIVIEMLRKHGFQDRADACYLQCFDQRELIRIRKELGVNLKLIQLLGSTPKRHLTKTGLAEIATYADGIGPSLGAVLSKDGSPTDLVSLAHDHDLLVHPYTLRIDSLSGFADGKSLLNAIFDRANADGIFTDFPDVCVEYLQP